MSPSQYNSTSPHYHEHIKLLIDPDQLILIDVQSSVNHLELMIHSNALLALHNLCVHLVLEDNRTKIIIGRYVLQNNVSLEYSIVCRRVQLTSKVTLCLILCN